MPKTERCAWVLSACGLCSICMSLSLCACACIHVFLFADSGALMLKDVPSFLHSSGLLWQPCWASLMSHMCHCRAFSSETKAQGDENNNVYLFIFLLISRLSQRQSLPVTQYFICCWRYTGNISAQVFSQVAFLFVNDSLRIPAKCKKFQLPF